MDIAAVVVDDITSRVHVARIAGAARTRRDSAPVGIVEDIDGTVEVAIWPHEPRIVVVVRDRRSQPPIFF